nr:hypothetical protein [uncultured Microbacterium sp.]
MAAIGAGALVASTFVALGATVAPQAAYAAPGQPGVPSAPTVLFEEDFENGTGVQTLPSYVSGQGVSYTADSYWLSTFNCNGYIVSFTDTRPPNYCFADNQFTYTAEKAYALGLLSGDAVGNRAVSTNSNGDGLEGPGVIPIAANQIEFATAGQISIPQPNRFVTFSVDASATACALSGDGVTPYPHPLLRFYLRTDAGVEVPVSTAPIDPCVDAGTTGNLQTFPPGSNTTDPNAAVHYGTFPANASTLLPGTSLGIVMRNEQGQHNGNDGAFDNIRILDVTPQLDKVFTPALTTTGGTSTLTFTITNTDELSAKNGWSFTDSLPAGLTVADPTAAATTCSAGVVTAAAGGNSVAVTGNLDAGQVSCTASLQVTSATPGTFTNGPGNVTQVGLNPPGDTSVTFQAPALTVLKTAGTPTDVNGSGITDAGDTIPFSFLVTNTGDVDLTGVTVNDPKVGAVACPATALPVGDDMTCTATYTITTADATAGAVLNTATATGTPPTGPPVTSPPSDTNTPVDVADPELTLDKSADLAELTAAGQTITYSFDVANTGNIAVDEITIEELDFSGTGELSDIVCPTGPLAAGAEVTCTATYVVTQADIDAGGVDNTAIASGTPAGSDEPIDSNDDTVAVPAVQTSALSIAKTGEITGEDYTVGAEVVYSFVVTNTGNTTLSDVVINEVTFSGTGELSDIVCPVEEAASLAPGDQVVCEATYALTQADIDAGEVTNSATATGTPPGDNPITSTPDDAVVPTPQDPELSIVKTADVEEISEVGQIVTYSFVITNTGNVTVNDPEVVETEFSGSGDLSVIECPADVVLVPDQFVTCTATYEVTQADLDSGTLTNTAVATGTTNGGDPTDPSDPSTVEVPTDPQPALSLVKSADKASVVGVGQIITYTFRITNTGNVTIVNATVTETQFSGTGVLSAVTCAPGAAALAPGASADCTATYRTTQADVTAGAVTNTAVASGTPATGGDLIPSNSSTIKVGVTPGPNLAVTGGEIATGVVGMALLLLIGGGILMTVRRRREEVTTH